MSREMQILWAGRHERDDWRRLCDAYRARIERLALISERVVKAPMVNDARTRRQLEAKALAAALPERAWVIAVDRGGRQLSSKAFSERLEVLRRDWPHSLVFVLGSDLGLDEEILNAARERLSLGKMTYPHNLARLILYEQIYRALSIGVGIKYHREPL